MNAFSKATRTWFEQRFESATEVQLRGWEAIARGAHALLVAPTGSGKTLAAFLSEIDRVARLPADAARGVRCVYVSPLKALVADVERNLREPLAGVQAAAEREGGSARAVRVDVRTGDTPQRERQRQARDPGEILVTTPESLFLILGSKQRETLRSVTTVIVDEIHALAPTKRGVHLALSLERLAELADTDPQRIGLSATVRPLESVARFLGGAREVELVDASAAPDLELAIRVPVPDMEHVPDVQSASEDDGLVAAERSQSQGAARERGLWPTIYPELLEAIRAQRSTIVFVNSRGLCERLVQRLNDLAAEELVLAHHGSVSHAKREWIEGALKRGEVRAIVATSSLELGIDMGAVDQVLLVESPGSVARGLQRVGRAGHGVGETSRGLLFPKFKGDLLESAVVVERMQRGEIESIRTPSNCLDVLAQQLVAMCCVRPHTPAELRSIVVRAHPYRELGEGSLKAVLDMLSGRYPSHELADLRPRLRWDHAADLLSARPGAAMTSRMNAGTIPDRGAFPVHLGEGGPRIGELDEEMIFESRRGDVIQLGASSWRVESITPHRVLVTPAPGEPGRLPFWKGEGPGRPLELGRALGAFVRERGQGTRKQIASKLRADLPLDENAARNLADHLVSQREHCGALPSDRAITVERFRDELGDWRVCLLSPFGARVHAPWAMALQHTLSRRAGVEVSVMHTDDGIVLRLADVEELPNAQELFPDPDELEELLIAQLGGTSLFASLFRENAVRSLLVTRRRPDQRSPLWSQRLKAQALLAVVQRHPSFPIVVETYRQAMADVFDLDGLREVLRGVRERSITVDEVETLRPSPFARSLVFAYVAAYLYDGDAPAAERKAQALTLDREMLRELLGREELRELLDGDVIAELEGELAGRADGWRARDRDELADLLRRIGDLDLEEIEGRIEGDRDDARSWLAELVNEGRVVSVQLAGAERWIASDDAGRYRDALGCALPEGLRSEFLEAGERPLEGLLQRHARARGPFHARDAARRFGLRQAQVDPLLRLLEQTGSLVLGELRPGGKQREWCDSEVLRHIKRRTLARLRNEVAAVEPSTFARFLLSWQGLRPTGCPPEEGARHAADERLLEVVDQLEGLVLPWSELVREVLPARVPGFRLETLDQLAARGELVWVGRGALGSSDGRVSLHRRGNVHASIATELEPDPLTGELQAAIRGHVSARGASFLTEIERAVLPDSGAGMRDLEAALWDLVWAGELTNDTFQPLRTLGRARAKGRRSARAQTLGGGRWSLVEGLDVDTSHATELALARSQVLLERYGVVSREMALSDELPGGWGPCYRVLRALEEAGRVRRGHFVEGLGGAQFASPGAADRLRARRVGSGTRAPAELHVLSAVDPANPWGSLLAWPELSAGAQKPRRVRGARLVLADGRPLLFVPPGGKKLSTFTPHDHLARALELLAETPRASGRRWLVVESVDAVPVAESKHRALFEAAGFTREPGGFAVDPFLVRARVSERDES